MARHLNRRQWFRNAFLATSGLTISSSLIQNLEAFPVSNAERAFKLPAGKKIRLNANENPYGPSEIARKAVLDILDEGNRYPFGVIESLKKTVAEKEGVDRSYIHFGAGSGSLLCQAGAAFGVDGGSILSGFPTFSVLMGFAEVFNCKWDKINLNDKLEFDYDNIASSIKSDTKLIVICNPNNPTGTLVDPAKVKAFCETVSKKVTVFSDEAYLEFLDPKQQVSMVDLVKKGANVIVSRTFSKIPN